MNRLCLTKKPFGPCPPDGYRYVFPEDGYVVHAWTYTDWVNEAGLHLRANGKEIPFDLGEQMEEQMCQTLPPGWCSYDDPNRARPNVSLSWGDFIPALSTFKRWLDSGKETVSQEEADRRALICSRCYLNVNITGCSGCQRLIADVVVAKKSKFDESIRGCAVCKCVLRAKVHFPIKTLDSENEKLQSMYPNHCWLKKDGPNYRGGDSN